MQAKKVRMFLVVIFCSFLMSQSKAQVLGFKAGLTVSDFVGELSTKSRVDVSAGFYADLDYNDRLSFQVEAIFNRIGATVKVDTQQIRFHYIAIPILAKYQLLDNISVYAGPQLSFLSTAQTYIREDVFDIQDSVSKADFGIAAGFAYEFPSGLSFDFRVYRGLIKTYKNTLLNPLLKNQVLHVSIAYLLVK